MYLLRRISRSYLLLILLTLALVGLANLSSVQRFFDRELGADLDARLALTTDALAGPLAAPDRGVPLARQTAKLAKLARVRVTVIAPDGAVLADSQGSPGRMENHADRPEFQEALRAGRGHAVRRSDTMSTPMLYAAELVRDPAGRQLAVVRVSLPITQRDALLRRLAFNLLLVALAGTLLSAGAGYLLARSVTRPLSEMSRVAKRMAAGDLEARVYPGERGELGELAESLNGLAREFTAMLRETDRERREAEAVLNSLSEVVIATDRTGRIALFNAAAERAFQVGEAEALGQPVLSVARLSGLGEGFSEVLSGRPASVREIATVPPVPRLYEAHLAPVYRSEGGVAGAVAVLHDVTELRRLERVRSEFVANVSHELRTPLTSLQGFVETLQDGAAEDPATRTRFLDIIANETTRLTRLVEDLLELSRLESGRLELHRRPVDLADLIERTVAFYSTLAASRAVMLAVQMPPDLPPVPGDDDLLEQVLRNLVDNAVKYTPGGGEVRISAEAGQTAGKPTVTVRVADTGPGIPEEHQPRLFERFYRADRARSRALGGTGLGLAIVKHIVERHGGRVWVESVPGAGATFSFTLPLE